MLEPDGSRDIIHMSGRSPGVLSRGGGRGETGHFITRVYKRTVPAGVSLFFRAKVIDVINNSEMPVSLRAQKK